MIEVGGGEALLQGAEGHISTPASRADVVRDDNNGGVAALREAQPLFSHVWASSPAFLIPRYFFGLAPAAPGWAAATLRPQPGPVLSGSANLPTVRGPVSVSFEQVCVRPTRQGNPCCIGTHRCSTLLLPLEDGGWAWRLLHSACGCPRRYGADCVCAALGRASRELHCLARRGPRGCTRRGR